MKNRVFIWGVAFACACVGNAVGRTCTSSVNIQCPVTAGAASCCRMLNETCAEAGCGGTSGGGDVEDCDPCHAAELTWTVNRLYGFQYRISGYMQDAITCRCTPQYITQCIAGRYGLSVITTNNIPTADEVDCKFCPSAGGRINPATSVAGKNNLITSCYIPANATGSDDTGTFTVSNDCYYTE